MSEELFRKAALERLSSPERLDTLLQILKPRHWISVACFTALSLAFVGWTILARIPVTVEGRGVLIHPRKVVGIQAPAAGRLLSLQVKVGDVVREGQLIAELGQTSVRQQLEQAEEQLATMLARQKVAREHEQRRVELERSLIKQQREHLQRRIKAAAEMSIQIRDQKLAALEVETQTLAARRTSLRQLLARSKLQAANELKRLEAQRKLKAKGVVSEQQVLRAEGVYLEAVSRVASHQTDLQALDTQEQEQKVKGMEIARAHLERIYENSKLEDQLAKYDIDERRLAQGAFQLEARQATDRSAVQRTVERLRLQLASNSKILADRNGMILEISANVGERLAPGVRIAAMAVEDPEAALVCVAYFKVKDGKQLVTEMDSHVTPDTVKRERYGSIRGRALQISPFPVSQEAARNLVGNAELAEELTKEGRQIEAIFSLARSRTTPSGYRWTSSEGPAQRVTTGTTTRVRVTVRRTAPIMLFIPRLKTALGL